MNKILFTTALAASMALSAHAQYKITAHLDSIPDGVAYLQICGENVDSATVKDGNFVIVGKKPLKGVKYASITDNKTWGMALWLGNENVTLKSNPSKRDIDIIGGKTQDEYEEYRRVMAPIWDEGRKALDDASKQTSEEERQRIEDSYHDKEDSVFMTFARRFPASYITVNHIYNKRVMDKYPFSKYSEMAKVFTPGAFEGEQWDTFMKIYNHDLELEPGRPFPAFSMNDVYGKNIDLADFKGKKVVLFTISNYVAPNYKDDFAVRRELYSKYRSKGLEMVDYSLAQEMVDVLKAVANYDLKWRFVTDLKGWRNPWLGAHEIDHITQNFLIDKNGVIIAKNVFGDDLKREIEKLF